MDITERPGWEPIEVGNRTLARHVASGKIFQLCHRCAGSGEYSYNPLDGTRCFGCSGRGLGKETTVEDEERRAAQRAKAAELRGRKAAQAAEEAAAKAAAWRAANMELLAVLHANASTNDFLGELLDTAQHRPLTQGQIDAAWAAVRRDQERREAREAQQAAGHFGTVGEKIEPTEVELVRATFFASERYDRQSQHLVIMRTTGGHVLKTWTSGQFGWDASDALEQGDSSVTWTITGTVKAHGDYNGTPETILIRVKHKEA